MSKEYEEFDNDEFLRAVMISGVSEWTQKSGTMLPKTKEEIKDLVTSGNSVSLWFLGRTPIPVAFGAITYSWPDNWYELGAVVVKPEFRSRGRGHVIVNKLINFAKEKYPHGNFFALCNEKSLKLFLDNGAQIITDPNMLPNEVWGECAKCPTRSQAQAQGKLCCDTPVLIK